MDGALDDGVSGENRTTMVLFITEDLASDPRTVVSLWM